MRRLAAGSPPRCPHAPGGRIVSPAVTCWRASPGPAPLSWHGNFWCPQATPAQSGGNSRDPFISASFPQAAAQPAAPWSVEQLPAPAGRSQGSLGVSRRAPMGAAPLARPSCSLTAPSPSPLTVSLRSVFQAIPLEPLRCRRGRPGPFWVSVAGRGRALCAQGAPSALPLGHGDSWGPSLAQLESPWLRHPAKGSECSR